MVPLRFTLLNPRLPIAAAKTTSEPGDSPVSTHHDDQAWKRSRDLTTPSLPVLMVFSSRNRPTASPVVR